MPRVTSSPRHLATSSRLPPPRIPQLRMEAQAPPAPVPSATDETDEILRRIRGQKGVIGILIVDRYGIPLETTLCSYSSVEYAGYLQLLTRTAQSTVREIDPEDALTFLRLRTEKYEIIVSPDRGKLLVVLQELNE
ncbi:dynein light chain roadblock-type 2-like [Ornithorhynchus anatinus]|uniref:Roadblock/LAMTOR2 domain-containing protein n=1 Tax=Ornithorhynchus anatinus TaxID=9258 RepID=A0A6I8NT90_ORNAN|nr:dynein light chain roadblock-type 2-like [Ornithorhynchus anatinus]